MADLDLRILASFLGAGAVVDAMKTVEKGLGMSGIGGALLGVGVAAAAAAVAIGVTAVKAAGDFQAGLTNLVTGAGELQSNLGMVGDGIKNIAIETGTSTKDLTSAMFMINSSGKIGADGLLVLRAAAQGAKTDNADLTDVSKALTGVLTNYHLPASQAAAATNELIAASQLGKMHMGELARSLGGVLPIAHNANVSFADVGAAIAMMTNANVSAQQASKNLAFALRALEAPSGVSIKSMKAIGLSAQDLKDTLTSKGLPAALQMIEDHIGHKFKAGSVEATTALKNIMGGSAGLNVALDIGGQNMETYRKGVDKINAALHAGGKSVEGWSTVQGTFNSRMAQAHEAVSVLMINIGTALLPVVTSLVGVFVNVVLWISNIGEVIGNVVHFFQSFAGTANDCQGPLAKFWNVIRAIGAFILSTFTPVWRQLAGIFKDQIKPAWDDLVKALQPAMPGLIFIAKIIGGVLLGALVLFIAALVVGVGVITAVVTAIIKGFANMLGGIARVFAGVVQIISGALQVVLGIIGFFADLFTGHFDKLGRDLGTIWHGIVVMWQGLWNVIFGILQAAWGLISGFFVGLVQGIIGFFRNLYNTLVGHSIVPDMINGIVSWFAQLPGRAMGAVQGLLGQIGGFFGNLASQALNWGGNIINNIAQGIRNAIGNVGAAIGSVTQFISDHLPKSPAKIGPLRNLQQQAALIPQQIALGMTQSRAPVSASMSTLLSPSMTGGGGTSTSSAGGGVVVNITINGMISSNKREMVDFLKTELSRDLNRSGNLVTWSSGGRS